VFRASKHKRMHPMHLLPPSLGLCLSKMGTMSVECTRQRCASLTRKYTWGRTQEEVLLTPWGAAEAHPGWRRGWWATCF